MGQGSFLFYSDFNCPFCFDLNERSLAIGEGYKIGWHDIQHMPAASSSKSDLADQALLINEVAIVRKRAPEISIAAPGFRPNTSLANQLIYSLRNESEHRFSELRAQIYRAYWLEGADISAQELLKALCLQNGLSFPTCLEGHQADPATTTKLQQWLDEWEGERLQLDRCTALSA